jgi:hypothetical protein
VAAGTPATDYAQHLLDIARSDRFGHAWTIAPAMARRSELEGRLISLLTPHRRQASRYAAPSMALIAMAAAGLVAAAAPAGSTQTNVEPPPVKVPVSAASAMRADQIAAERHEGQQQRASRRALVRALEDGSNAVREQAAMGLALRSEPDVVGALIRALKDPAPQVREKAAMGLAFRRQPGVLDALIEAAGDADAQVREKAVFALGVSRDARAIAALARAAQDPDQQVREKAVQGLGLAGR